MWRGLKVSIIVDILMRRILHNMTLNPSKICHPYFLLKIIYDLSGLTFRRLWHQALATLPRRFSEAVP
jgi:hypothetical protein